MFILVDEFHSISKREAPFLLWMIFKNQSDTPLDPTCRSGVRSEECYCINLNKIYNWFCSCNQERRFNLSENFDVFQNYNIWVFLTIWFWCKKLDFMKIMTFPVPSLKCFCTLSFIKTFECSFNKNAFWCKMLILSKKSTFTLKVHF